MEAANEPLDIVVIGAGVVGTIYAVRLARAGHRVTVVDRGRRLADVRDYELVLESDRRGEWEQAYVETSPYLPPDARHRYAIVAVRHDQIRDILPMLARARTVPNLVFMVNHVAGHAAWAETVGPDRVILGFPGAGGGLYGHVVRWRRTPRWVQPTLLGEPDGTPTRRIAVLRDALSEAGLPTRCRSDVDAWQRSHVAWALPCAFATNRSLVDGTWPDLDPELVRTAVLAAREGLHVLEALGHKIVPRALHVLRQAPIDVLVRAFRHWARTEHYALLAEHHARVARVEMESLAREFVELARKSGAPTPALNALYSGKVEGAALSGPNGSR